MVEAGPELDALVAERVMGLNLKPPRDLALARVGARYVCSRGSVFHLTTGDDLPMRPGVDLPPPEGSTHWNDRYFAEVGRFLGDKIRAEVEMYRLPAEPYSTETGVAWQVVERMISQGFVPEYVYNPYSQDHGFYFSQEAGGFRASRSYAKTVAEAICRAALAALERRDR